MFTRSHYHTYVIEFDVELYYAPDDPNQPRDARLDVLCREFGTFGAVVSSDSLCNLPGVCE